MSKNVSRHRIEHAKSASIGVWSAEGKHFRGEKFSADATIDCGWGQLIFGHTFGSNEELTRTILDEKEGRRNLALYISDPHVVLSIAPQDLFLDPSHTYRLWLSKYLPARVRPSGFSIRRLQRREDAAEIHRVLTSCQMVSAGSDRIWEHRKPGEIQYFVAEDTTNGRILGTVMAVDHVVAFQDPEDGSSLWCLAVDPQSSLPGVGRALVAHIADHFAARGRAFLDLSVMHDNLGGIKLYEQLGFERVPVFCIKRRNAINRNLYVGRKPDTALNPYAKIIVDEALKRGISAEVIDAEYGYFSLTNAGRTITCRESLSDLTSAVAMSRCDNKIVTRRIALDAGIRVPEQQTSARCEENEAFLRKHGAVVVKPARGEQGHGVSVNITSARELNAAVDAAKRFCADVVLESFVRGEDLRVVVINDEVVAAAIRKPATIVGNGVLKVSELIEKQSRRRSAATGGESIIPIDSETERCLAKQGLNRDDVPELGREVRVRETANLHTGGTLHDVTGRISALLENVSKDIARALNIPVVGLDFVVTSPEGGDYVLIEANERPGLANHEPQPTAERFVDLLFPETARNTASQKRQRELAR